MTTQKRILLIYYSYSSQTRKLINAFKDGLEEGGIPTTLQQVKTSAKLQFPLGSISSTLQMMVETFFRKRYGLVTPEVEIANDWDLIIIAGPTWSYNPSGPILSFLDNHGEKLKGKKVKPFISCRGYWRSHFWQLRSILVKKGANVVAPLVFLHPGKEPWRTLGVFLKIAGKTPESDKSWLSRYYPRFGHTKEQVNHARKLGIKLASAINQDSLEMEVPQIVVNVPKASRAKT